ncbi:hypothetical protein [Blastococcus deserti]|uniref:Uncharacterized protein n=1 Tax=Blastococcus deserti TaxID=2259033 RepID=A0ABW4XCM3_9ACTN
MTSYSPARCTPDASMTATGPVGEGQEPTPEDRRLMAVAADLGASRALERITSNARATVGTVALVGVVLTGLGLVSVPTLLTDDISRTLALLALLTAFLSVVSGALYLALRLERVNVTDLVEVAAWYERQLARARYAVAASWLLLGALLLAGVATGAALVQAPDGPVPALSLRLSGSGDARVLSTDVTVGGLKPGDLVSTRVVGEASASCPEVVVFQAGSRADRSGTATAAGSLDELPCNETFRLAVSRSGEELASLTFP